MPAFVKGKQGEKVWGEAKASVHRTHPDLSEDDEQFWKIVTTIYKKRRPQDIKKTANNFDTTVDRVLQNMPISARVAAIGAPIATAGTLGLYNSYKNAAYMKHLNRVNNTNSSDIVTKSVDAVGQGMTNAHNDDFRRAFPDLYPNVDSKGLYNAAHRYGHARSTQLSPLTRIVLSASPYLAAVGSGLLTRALTGSHYGGALTGAGVGGLTGFFANRRLYEDEKSAAQKSAEYIKKSQASAAAKADAIRLLNENYRNIQHARWLDIALPLTSMLGTIGTTHLIRTYRPQITAAIKQLMHKNN